LPILAIDTATETLSIALGEKGSPVAETTIAAGRSHLELLLPAVDRLLLDHEYSISSLQAICIGLGPGTFSGLRVGVVTARGLAQGLGLPLTGSSSLAALATGLVTAPESRGRRLLPVIDAKRGQVFSQLFLADDAGKVTPQSEIMCLSAADLLQSVRDEDASPVFAGGDGTLAYMERFSTDGVIVPEPDNDLHRVKARYHLPAFDLTAGYSIERIMDVIPTYVRDPDADKTILLRKKEPWLR
jgi:tRNA threonylcarbamoyladenosine biosynthesis protein TsaB